jgi:hypothetical protein
MEHVNGNGNAIDHTIRRVRERYGMEITLDDLIHVRRKILHGECQYAGRSRNPERNYYLVTLRGVTIKFLYNEPTQRIMSAVPLEFRTDLSNKRKAECKKKFFRQFVEDEADDEQSIQFESE